jgi:hypothetical protein
VGWYPATFAQRSVQATQPRIFYLIASERPLRVEPYIGSSLSLRAAMAGMMYSYSSPQRMLDGLARLVVPNHASGDWVSDVYMEWPQPTYRAAEPIRTHVIQCDGRRYVVPFYVTTCPIDRATPPVRDSTVVTDNGTPRQPERRRPERGAVGDDRGRTGAGAGGEARPTRPEPTRDREARPVPAERPRETPPPAAEPQRPAPPPAQPQVDRSPPRAEPSRAEPPRSGPPPRAEPSAPRPEPPAPAPRSEPPAPRTEPPAPRMDPPAPRPTPEPRQDVR